MSEYRAILITGYGNLSKDDLESLRTQKVDIDDWDLMLFFQGDKPVFYEDGKVYVSDYQIQRLLDSHSDCEPAIYPLVVFRGEEWCLGVRHH